MRVFSLLVDKRMLYFKKEGEFMKKIYWIFYCFVFGILFFISGCENQISSEQSSLESSTVSYDFSKLIFEDKRVEFDGNFYSIDVEGEIPEGIRVVYRNGVFQVPDYCNIGVYEYNVDFYSEHTNEKVLSKRATLTIYSDDLYRGNSFTFAIIDEHQAAVTGYTGTEPDVIVPKVVNIDGITCFVTQLDNAFTGNNNITNITLNPQIKELGYEEFDGCKSLNNVYFDGTIEEWLNIDIKSRKSNPMCSGLMFHFKEDGQYVKATDLVIPEGITEIPSYAFYGFTCSTSVSLPSTLESIGHEAFASTFLTTVDIPNSVTNIGREAFSYCIYLNDIKLSNNLETIENGTFSYCIRLTSIEIPEKVTKINSSSFYDCRNLTKVILPSTIKYIEGFWNDYIKEIYYRGTIEEWCEIEFPDYSSGLSENGKFYLLNEENEWEECKKIVLLPPITKIKPWQFRGFSNLEEIIFSSYIIEIGDCAFEYCSSLKVISLPTDLEKLGSYAFSNCTSLEKVSIDGNLKEINYSAFNNCTSLSSVIYQDQMYNWYDISFANEKANPVHYAHNFYIVDKNEVVLLESIEVPIWINKIKEYQFAGFSKISNIYIHSNVKEIGKKAFIGCNSAIINCSFRSQPEGWSDEWNYSNCEVNWNYYKNREFKFIN